MSPDGFEPDKWWQVIRDGELRYETNVEREARVLVSEISGVPIYAYNKRIGTGYTKNESLTILWDSDFSVAFKDMAKYGLVSGINIELILIPMNPKVL